MHKGDIMTVKTFNGKELESHLKNCDPYILQYIKALKNDSKQWEDIAHTATEKFRASSSNDYMKCPDQKCGGETHGEITCSICGNGVDW